MWTILFVSYISYAMVHIGMANSIQLKAVNNSLNAVVCCSMVRLCLRFHFELSTTKINWPQPIYIVMIEASSDSNSSRATGGNAERIETTNNR